MSADIQDPEWVSFGDVARDQLGEQCQYASRMIKGILGSPNLGEGLRFAHLDSNSYHFFEIHRDDVDTFVSRAKEHRAINGQ